LLQANPLGLVDLLSCVLGFGALARTDRQLARVTVFQDRKHLEEVLVVFSSGDLLGVFERMILQEVLATTLPPGELCARRIECAVDVAQEDLAILGIEDVLTSQ
jgi:hypothetical protein